VVGEDPRRTWSRAAAAARSRGLEERLAWHIKVWGLPTPEREHRFDATRRWRFDFAWPAFRVAAEVEGLTPQGGRHQRMAGFQGDAEKYTAAQLAGWAVPTVHRGEDPERLRHPRPRDRPAECGRATGDEPLNRSACDGGGPRLGDDESERRLRQLLGALRAEVLDAQAHRRRRSIWLEVVVEGGRVSEDSGLEARRYPLGRP
jgi:hypothetical protein